ncbi:Lipoprotein-releasing system transmembrane protein LolE [Rubripirellula lacrimiformis]|uniref:Lipoprotein-releasing system transmembrane protein LolE n=1 Tax=Rubripirellula lacrimiformis TaxID=1930273 RepID=A0A517N7L3_9BACT|nr:FtsX-like permease family protein [Rubripirellula lacrimiformis]QDT03122.1 Lipoprotein-releasing system transmembrane protein LolE [Rubripirellula lacrimiformis]
MYRWLLCFRYLRTRYIALASIISVTLGVATLIVVNSVMAGFSAEMHDRLHGLASDILIECHTSGGMPDPDARLAEIKEVCGDQIAGASVSVHVPAMLGIDFNGQLVTRHVNLVGVEPETYDTVSHFGRYLLHPENKEHVTFDLRNDGYAPDRDSFPPSGWAYRTARVAYDNALEAERNRFNSARGLTDPEAASAGPIEADSLADAPKMTFAAPGEFLTEPTDGGPAARTFDPAVDQFPGLILGISTSSVRYRDENNNVADRFYCRPGDDVRMMFPNAADNTKVVNQKFTVVDMYESGMSEYDSTFAFCRLDQLQDFRGMIDPQSGTRSITTIQLKLVEGASLNEVRDALRRRFPPHQFAYDIQTWRDMQGPLLAAVRLETTILNILLFLIIAVAGFGILATFFMIVVEKTRDIGTLKALGASGAGVMSIFLSYGLLLGFVGSGAGLIGGLLFVRHINSVAGVIEKFTGQEVFDPTVYYFTEIPTIIYPFTLVWVMVGAVAIAAMASVLPALRAARMHPVRALRFE